MTTKYPKFSQDLTQDPTKRRIWYAIAKAKPYILKPIMLVEMETPNEYMGRVQGDISSRRGLLLGSETM